MSGSSETKTALILGASRGIGRALALDLKERGWNVIGSVRKLTEIPGVRIIQLDLNDEKSIQAASADFPPIDLLVVSGAIAGTENLLETSSEHLHHYLDTNVVGPHRAVQAFLPALRRGNKKQIVLISSMLGSNEIMFGRDMELFSGPYSITKAALNMMAVLLHNYLQKDGFTVIPIHPGWVDTDLGKLAGPGAMPISESVGGIAGVIEDLTPEKSAKFVNWKGEPMPW
ncbi:uncharacterized protein PFL1_00999 [Pseudozyma flocculosa PF-1]|uniref:Uncharacterized protein n=1 Tax=Pseudozyma flocculosa TaxID=84751 RepID=A0A5C3F8J6_9BASI|nr:uncharacterized protein PFL1_00999 [Pseudozyma flocculosa PF-1]EPQ31666.1 hypothetical protein PFL1_00999 [Pseudozyma flocculosa PF-1]SPO40783.1 uncharacterized protein PSFLO_06265 [Pseudozyma flocculosa]